MKINNLLLIILTLIILNLQPVFSLNYTYYSKFNLSSESLTYLNEYKDFDNFIIELNKNNLPVNRFSDSLLLVEDLLMVQLLADINNATPDYSQIKVKFDEINNLKDLIFESNDELKIVKKFVSELPSAIKFNPEVVDLVNKAEKEFYAERFEDSLVLTNSIYHKISDLEAFDTKLKAFYEATSRNIINSIKRICTR
jgi:hypothetical protein